MKKGFAFLLAGVLACSCFTGCGGAKDSVSESSETSQIVTTAPAETKSIETTVTKSAGTSSQDSSTATVSNTESSNSIAKLSTDEFIAYYNKNCAALYATTDLDTSVLTMTKTGTDSVSGGTTCSFFADNLICIIGEDENGYVNSVTTACALNVFKDDMDSDDALLLLSALISPVTPFYRDTTYDDIVDIVYDLTNNFSETASNCEYKDINGYLFCSDTSTTVSFMIL